MAGWIVAGIFALGLLIALAVHFGWGISTQHRDHDVAAEGPLLRRRMEGQRPPQPHAGPVNPEAIPADPATGERPAGLSTGPPPPQR